MTRFSLRHVLIALATCVVLYVAGRHASRFKPAAANTPVTTEGSFVLNGQYSGTPLSHGANLRQWGSWAGSDDNTGTIAIGPFTATKTITVGLSGYPRHAGNSISIRRDGTNETRAFTPPHDIGERWDWIEIPVPTEWVGQSITLVATDHATGLGGWLGITEPVRGGPTAAMSAILTALAAWAIDGAAIACLFFAFATALRRQSWIPDPIRPLAAAAGVAATAYAAFWIYFANRTAGLAYSIALLAIGAIALIQQSVKHRALSRDVATVAKLSAAIGFLYVSLLFLFSANYSPYALAANRFIDGLPADNELPHLTAETLYAGESLRNPAADWLSSDRPPLQAGWILLTRPISPWLADDVRLGSLVSAIWLQLLWVAAVYGLLRVFGLTERRAAGWTAIVALTGFCVQNTLFTWPKLSAAAFGLGAYAVWFAPGMKRTAATFALGAIFAALAFLSHGGIAFSFLPLAPWAAWRCLRGEWRSWLLAASLFVALVAPWMAYQHFYDPPGNRLLKMHLAGQIDKDPRGTWQTIHESYRSLPWSKLVEYRVANFRAVLGDRWKKCLTFSAEFAGDRRVAQFFNLIPTLGWWLIAIPIAPIVMARRKWPLGAGPLFAWIAATVVLWCLLMFQPGQAIIHQGSYAVPLAHFIFSAIVLDSLSRWWLPLVALLQGASLATTWIGPNASVHGAAIGAPFVCAAALGLAVPIVRSMFGRAEPAGIAPSTGGVRGHLARHTR